MFEREREVVFFQVPGPGKGVKMAKSGPSQNGLFHYRFVCAAYVSIYVLYMLHGERIRDFGRLARHPGGFLGFFARGSRTPPSVRISRERGVPGGYTHSVTHKQPEPLRLIPFLVQ